MKIIELYLDANVLIAYYFPNDDDNQHPRIKKCLRKIRSKNIISLIASRWTMDETERGITKKTREMAEDEKIVGTELDFMYSQASKFITKLWMIKRLGDIKFEIKKINRNISAETLLENVGEIASLGNYADALHYVIMNIFNIEYVLTFDEKDFKKFEKQIGNIIPINPDNINDLI